MTKLKFLLFFLFITTGYAQAQWEIQLNVEGFTYLDRICFIDSLNGWAIGGASLGAASPYFYTIDGGENWYLDDDWMTIYGTDIVFVNYDTGFIATENGKIYKTTDNGQTWDTIQTPATQNVVHLFFVDENNGWATLYNSGNLLHTTNGGTSWNIVTTTLSYISDLFIVENNNIWCSGWVYLKSVASSIIYSNDNGLNWNEKYSDYSNFFYSVFFINQNIGWIGGQIDLNDDLPYILKTENMGDNWIEQIIESEYCTEKINCIYFINDTVGWLGVGETQSQCNYGAVYFTNDGGENWQLQQEFDNPILDIYALNKDTAWAVGEDFIYRNNNADTVIITSINEVNKEKAYFTLQPNPVKDKIQIRIFNKFDNVNIQIRNVTGVIIKQFPVSQKKFTINLSFLQKGIYFLTLTLNNQIIQTQKIIKL